MKKESLLFWPRHRSRAREDLISSTASKSLEGEEDLSYLHWVPTLKERPALGVLSVSKHLEQKSRFGAHARGEAYYNSVVSPTGCLNTRAT